MKNKLFVAVLLFCALNACVKTTEEPIPAVVKEEYFLTVYRTINTGGAEIAVMVNGKNAGTITSINPATPPCGEPAKGWVKYAVSPGKYDITATGKDGKTWSLSLTISQPSCAQIKIEN